MIDILSLQWRIQKFWKGGAKDNLSVHVLIYRKAQHEIYAFYTEKAAFWNKYEPIRERRPPPRPPFEPATVSLQCA